MHQKEELEFAKSLLNLFKSLSWVFVFLIIFLIYFTCRPYINVWWKENQREKEWRHQFAEQQLRMKESASFWSAADISTVKDPAQKQTLSYGKELIAHTAKYLGPKGLVKQISNGMNCQNCHLAAGTKPWGNNYGSVAATYPKYRARSGTKENIYKRINDCIERSLNGIALDEDSHEMQAIKSYIEFIGSTVPKKEKAKASGIIDLPFLDRPLDTLKGKIVYEELCQRCHGQDGQGTLAFDSIEYTYPPLWGPHSYNLGAGLFRMSRLAGYVKNNMPDGATYVKPLLTDEQAWDVAAYINTRPRPKKDLSKDWPKIEEKPVDHPFGPYADVFDEKQHKFGPFQPIEDLKNKNKKK